MKPFEGFKRLYKKTFQHSTDFKNETGSAAVIASPTPGTAQNGALGVVPTGRPKVSFYENASNFIVHNPIMGENIRVTQVQSSMNVLKEMLDYVIPGVAYDSSVRDSPPRCHPGTRSAMLLHVTSRIHDPSMTTRMVWIRGPAGVGKTAIMQTLAEEESSRRSGPFTTLFFSRPNERDDPKRVFTTLAFGFAVSNLEYRSFIGEKLLDDPTFLMKSVDEQFQRLFVTPFIEKRVNFGSQRWIVFVDGLDECRGEREQCRIVDLIRDSIVRYAAYTPFVWVISSRPEAHLETFFAKVEADIGESLWELEVPIDSDQSSQDVQRYLRAQFLEIGEMYANSVPSLWPSETDFMTLARASAGLFVFATTLVGYLLGGDPVLRLKQVVALIKRSDDQTIDPRRNPFKALDLLYTQIMSDIPEEVLSVTIHLLGFYLLDATLKLSPSPVPLLMAGNILGLEQHTAYAAVRKLHSVLACPLPDEADQQPIRFLHASFSDFITDPFRSQVYHIDQNRELAYVWQCCTRTLSQFAVNGDYLDINLYWPPSGASQPKDLCQARLLVYVQFWWQKTLVKFCRDPSTESPPRISLPVDNVSLTRTFKDLGPSIFLGVERQGYLINEFLTWLDYDSPLDFRAKFIVEKFPIHKLDVDRLFRSLCAQQWCIAWRGSGDYFTLDNIDLGAIEGFGVSEWAEGKEALWNKSGVLSELVVAKTTVVRVVGLEPSKLCILVGPVSNRVKTAYYVLPYASESA